MSTEVVRYAPGTFCWVEMGTPYPDGSVAFYSAFFKWTAEEVPMPSGRPYTMLLSDGIPVAGLHYMSQPGIPPIWLAYVAVENVDDSTRRALDLGANLMSAPLDITDRGRMAVLSDPDGALFALWQPGSHPGAQLINVPGSSCWNELMTRNPERCGEFYSALLGWSAQPMNNYVLFKLGERGVAGMMPMPADADRVPPQWLNYFAVDDCDIAFGQAQSLGAMVLTPPSDIPSIGRFAVLQDPVGAVFAIVKMVS